MAVAGRKVAAPVGFVGSAALGGDAPLLSALCADGFGAERGVDCMAALGPAAAGGVRVVARGRGAARPEKPRWMRTREAGKAIAKRGGATAPEDPDAWAMSATAHGDIGDWSTASKSYTKSAKLYGDIGHAGHKDGMLKNAQAARDNAEAVAKAAAGAEAAAARASAAACSSRFAFCLAAALRSSLRQTARPHSRLLCK